LRFLAPKGSVPKLRISIVEYLNTAPLVWGFTDGPLAGRYDLAFTMPSLCAEALRRGEADVAIIPAIEYQRIPGLVALPGMAVAAKGPVRSILVLAKQPIERARRIALDVYSRSSAALVRLLCARRWHIHPEFFEAHPNPAAMLRDADAALVIGDPALRVAVRMDELAEKRSAVEFCCAGDPDALPVPGLQTLFLYDLAHEWREMTGLPCVLAIWAARRDSVGAAPALVADFLASKEYGLARLEEIAEAASLKLEMPAPALERYLRENIDFSLDEANLAGLDLYYRLAAASGLIERVQPLEFATEYAIGPATTASSKG